MDKQKIKDQLQEIKTELAYMRGMLTNICSQLQESKDSNEIRELYEHPWYKYKREELIASKNYKN
jgi:hypothetical protein